MSFKRIIVLANSYKNTGRCIAGREVGPGDAVGGWLRPISEEPEGELLPRHLKIDGFSQPQVLEIVDVPVVRLAGDKAHPEDWLVDVYHPWRRHSRYPIDRVAALEEKPDGIWSQPGARTDRIESKFLCRQCIRQSLYLIRPTQFRVELTHDYNEYQDNHRKRARACFSYGGCCFSLSLTDPVVNQVHAKDFPEPDAPARTLRPACGDNCLLCVSLTPEFHGHHYKVVATVLELP